MILRDMNEGDVAAVLCIEQEVHAYPWTSGNFVDALRSKYLCKIFEHDYQMVGYAVLMLAYDEAELLDIAIGGRHQRQGLGGRLLEEMIALARRSEMRRMVLEVRPSNAAAIRLYRNQGFSDIGLRRDYYPAAHGREDAILMGRLL